MSLTRRVARLEKRAGWAMIVGEARRAAKECGVPLEELLREAERHRKILAKQRRRLSGLSLWELEKEALKMLAIEDGALELEAEELAKRQVAELRAELRREKGRTVPRR